MTSRRFPDGFIWGTGTSAPQIEGGCDEGGRGESIWDHFAAHSGKIEDGSDPSIACDHFHRWREDIGIMKGLGLGAYRFSIAWPRIQPTGSGAANQAGLDFYDALVDGLLEAGITPFPTLYHWDLPQALQERGGWASRETVAAFEDYAGIMARKLGDRVRQWVTHNEPWCIATLGHEEGHHAPGHKDPAEGLRVAHHLLLSHGRAMQVIRSIIPGAEVGLVHNYCPAYPATDTAADRDAARWFHGFFNKWYLDPIFRGAYPADAIADRIAAGHLTGPDLPYVEEGDLDIISTPMDFLGVNYYSRVIMKAGEDGRPVAAKPAAGAEITDMDWEVFPQGLHDSLLRIKADYAPPEIHITENGAAFTSPLGDDGRIVDTNRIAYLRDHLLAIRSAIDDGVPVRSYYAWSLLDNFEWGFGYGKRFGLYAVDEETRDRIPKESAFWYRDVVAANAVDDAHNPISHGESDAIDQ